MTQKSEVGKLGEDLACEYLVNKRFTIIERNFRKPWGELDIITKDSQGTLVFIEVKTMRQSGNSTIAGLRPEDNLTKAKLKKLQRTAQLYVSFNENLVNEKNGWRIDLIAINIINGVPQIKHFENL